METLVQTSFGRRVQQLRERLRLSQEDAAKVAGVSSRTIARYEQREEPPKNTRICERIAQKTGTDLGWLLTGEGPKPAPTTHFKPAASMNTPPSGEAENERISEDELAEAMLKGALRYARRLTQEIGTFAEELRTRLDAREATEAV